MIYLNVAGLSPFNQHVQQEVTAALEKFSQLLYSDEGIHYYRKTLQAFRKQLAHWLHVDEPDHIQFVPNATTASWLALSRIRWKPGDHVLTTTHENSTITKEILGLHIHGVHVHSLEPQSPTNFENEVEQLLKTKQIRAIVMSHVSHIDGRIFPIEQILRLTQQYRVLLLVDGAQAVGHIPISFEDGQPDAYFFPGHKWCEGPMGTGTLILGRHFSERGDLFRDDGREGGQPLWSSFELGTQNIGLIAGLAKACRLKEQEDMKAFTHQGTRQAWKTCLQEHHDLQILEWEGPHSPGILSFSCLNTKTTQFFLKTAKAHALSWKSFNHPSFPSKYSVRVSWSHQSTTSALASTLALLNPR